MSLHLFRLPESIYIDIINTMNPCEQFFTSLCSRKAYSIIKTHRSEIEYSRILTYGNGKFDFGHYAETFLTFYQSSELPNQGLKELMIDGNLIPFELKEDNVVTTYWAELIVGTMKLIEYVCDLFNIVVRDMEIHCNSGDRLMKWVQQRQTLLVRVCFDSNDCEENQFNPETLENLIVDCEAESIILDAYTTHPLRLQQVNKKCDFFGAAIGSWFTLENLMTLDCIDIWVMERNFTSTEMNRFFKHWMNGGSPRLTLLQVDLDNYNEQELMDGIDVKWNMKTVYVSTEEAAGITTFDGFYEIQKTTNGMSAGFKFKDGFLYFGVWPCSVPLFRLPHLAFMNIINQMGATEQFMTSLCSRRAYSTIKTLRRKTEGIRITAGNEFLFIDKGSERLTSVQFNEASTQKEMVTINGKSVLFAYDVENDTINTFWAEPIVGTMELVEHVTSLFDIQMDTVIIKKDSGIRLMNWVQRRQRSLRMVEVNSFNKIENQFESEDLNNILMECKADHIQLKALHSSPFEIQNLNKKFEKFECLRGTWITVDNLMTLDCVSITVQERRFTCAEINRFINHWLQGGSFRLRMLLVTMADFNDLELFEGLNAHWTTGKIVVVSYLQTPYEITEFFEVDRHDGLTAGFTFDIIPGQFRFGVWPSDTGNFIDMRSY
uniref:F-box domain-containing protein n=1 Tax=Caenorhabditis tropicalis TaxID=1561998 RepID=A0A1I7UN00_9PELO